MAGFLTMLSLHTILNLLMARRGLLMEDGSKKSRVSVCFSLGIHLFRVPLKAMAPHSSTLAWKIPWTEEPGGLQSMGSLRVGHD